MRTQTTQETKVHAAPAQAVYARVKVLDRNGTFRDTTNLEGYDFLQEVNWDFRVDQPVAQANVTLMRDVFKLSLSPFMDGSLLNRLPTGSAVNTLIKPARTFQVETATVPVGTTPASGDWHLMFEGIIDNVATADQFMSFTGRDFGGRLGFIKTEKVYGSDAGTDMETVMQQIIDDNTASAAWVVSHSYTTGDRVYPTTPNGFFYEALTTHTSSGAEPTWIRNIGSTQNEGGGAGWICRGLRPVVTLPDGSPAMALKKYVQKTQPILDALRERAVQRGWDVRYTTAGGSTALVLFDPNRTKSTVDRTWTTDDTLGVAKADIGDEDVRNMIQGVYSDPADLDANGQPKRKIRTVTDSTSENEHGEKWMQVAEDAASNINSSTTMDRMLNAALSDLKDPKLDFSAVHHYFFPADLGDRYTYAANGVQFDTDQTLAVVGVKHSITQSEHRSTFDLRGTPSGDFNLWLKSEARPGIAPSPATATPDTPSNVQIKRTPEGVTVTFDQPVRRFAKAELHLSKSSSGFTPDSTTKAATSDTNRFTVTGLDPGATYYAKVIAIDDAGNRSTASGASTFSAAYNAPFAMQPQVAYDRLPFNSNFEANNDAGGPPDTWTVASGTWGTDIFLQSGTYVYSGGKSIKFVGANKRLLSQPFPVLQFTQITVMVSALWDAVGATHQAFVKLRYYDETLAQVGTSAGVTQTITGGGSWLDSTVFHTDQVAAGAVYAAIEVGSGASNSSGVNIFIDDARAVLGNEPWVNVNTSVGFGTNWFHASSPPSGYNLVEFRRDSRGYVELRGLARCSSTGSTIIFTLPVGYRPALAVYRTIPVFNGTTFSQGVLQVSSNGNVVMLTTPSAAANNEHSLDGYTFSAEQ